MNRSSPTPLRMAQSVFLTLCLLLSGLLSADQEVWIDVRSAEEYASGHVEQAINIPYDVIGADIAALGLAKDQPIYLYCRSGRRSGIALETLQAQGYSQVSNIGSFEDAQQWVFNDCMSNKDESASAESCG